MTEYLMIGEVLKPQGLRGECKIRPHAADLSLFETWTTLYRREKDGSFTPVSLALRRIHDGFVYAVLGDCRSPEDAEMLRDILKNEYGKEVDLITYIGSVIGAHAGPGTLALFFRGKER